MTNSQIGSELVFGISGSCASAIAPRAHNSIQLQPTAPVLVPAKSLLHVVSVFVGSCSCIQMEQELASVELLKSESQHGEQYFLYIYFWWPMEPPLKELGVSTSRAVIVHCRLDKLSSSSFSRSRSCSRGILPVPLFRATLRVTVVMSVAVTLRWNCKCCHMSTFFH